MKRGNGYTRDGVAVHFMYDDDVETVKAKKKARARRTLVQFSVAQGSRLRKAGSGRRFSCYLVQVMATYVCTVEARTPTNAPRRQRKTFRTRIVCFHQDSARPPRIVEITTHDGSAGSCPDVKSSNCRVLQNGKKNLNSVCDTFYTCDILRHCYIKL